MAERKKSIYVENLDNLFKRNRVQSTANAFENSAALLDGRRYHGDTSRFGATVTAVSASDFADQVGPKDKIRNTETPASKINNSNEVEEDDAANFGYDADKKT